MSDTTDQIPNAANTLGNKPKTAAELLSEVEEKRKIAARMLDEGHLRRFMDQNIAPKPPLGMGGPESAMKRMMAGRRIRT